MRTPKMSPIVKENRARLINAFSILRKRGLAARANFMCCMSCGIAEMEKKYEGKKEGFVFWYRQGEDDIRELGRVHLCLGCFGSFDEVRDEKVGREVVPVLREAGLNVIWNGDVCTKILVDLKEVN